MSKGLEALERMARNVETNEYVFNDQCCEDYNTIEKELKALEIMKNKEVQIATLILSNTCDGYNFSKGLLGKFLTQEEYNLLKEVLL